MNQGWQIVFGVTIGLVLAVLFLFFVLPVLFGVLLDIKKMIERVGYRREAKKHNARARLLRLERTAWMGFPLPTGQEGTLRITDADIIRNPHRVSNSQMERAYRDRALDLKVDIAIVRDVVSRDWVITWRPHKGKWPKEKY